ncbi:hypothetical protein FB451DRAFT_1180294 [Mycena latifolia]|nr:hypothetical protein FB451DRAFT_1180294 [Mycena latifolia]
MSSEAPQTQTQLPAKHRHSPYERPRTCPPPTRLRPTPTTGILSVRDAARAVRAADVHQRRAAQVRAPVVARALCVRAAAADWEVRAAVHAATGPRVRRAPRSRCAASAHDTYGGGGYIYIYSAAALGWALGQGGWESVGEWEVEGDLRCRGRYEPSSLFACGSALAGLPPGRTTHRATPPPPPPPLRTTSGALRITSRSRTGCNMAQRQHGGVARAAERRARRARHAARRAPGYTYPANTAPRAPRVGKRTAARLGRGREREREERRDERREDGHQGQEDRREPE